MIQKFSSQTQLALVTLICAILFTACQREDSADVNQDKIYTHYELFYNSNSDKTVAVAQFRFGNPAGTLLELFDPASVTFDGETLPYKLVYNGHAKEFAGKLDGGTFVYTDVDGSVFTNSIPEYEEIQFPTDFDSLSKSSAYDLKWNGTALSANQQVGMFIGSWTWGDDALFFTNDDGADNIILGVNQMSNLATGPSTCFMDRATVREVSQGTSEGGVVIGKYRATNRDIEVVE